MIMVTMTMMIMMIMMVMTDDDLDNDQDEAIRKQSPIWLRAPVTGDINNVFPLPTASYGDDGGGDDDVQNASPDL